MFTLCRLTHIFLVSIIVDNWGRVIREMRVRLNDNDQILDDASVLLYTLDKRIAWGVINHQFQECKSYND